MEVRISQDIRRYKTKDVGIFSFAEAGCIALAIGAGFAGYRLFGSVEKATVPIVIILVAGFLKPFGMSCAAFFRTVLMEMMSPRVYPCETDFIYDLDELYAEETGGPAPPDEDFPVKRTREEQKQIIK